MDGYCWNHQVLGVTEYHGSGRERYMVRQRDPANPSAVLPDTTRWSDYDDETIYGDYVFDEVTGQVVDTTAYLPGVAQMDTQSGEIQYFHGDQIGTLRAVTRVYGEPVQMSVNTAFGEKVYLGGTGVPPVETRYRYAGAWGYETDSDPAMQPEGEEPFTFLHVGYRYYDPSTGRFLQRDPIGIMGGLNVYEYASSLPTSRVDAAGLTSIIGGPPSATGSSDSGMFDPFWTKVHYGFGVGAGLSGMSFCKTTWLAIKWEFWEPDHWPIQPFTENLRNQVGDVIAAQIGWFDAQPVRSAIRDAWNMYCRMRRAQRGLTMWD